MFLGTCWVHVEPLDHVSIPASGRGWTLLLSAPRLSQRFWCSPAGGWETGGHSPPPCPAQASLLPGQAGRVGSVSRGQCGLLGVEGVQGVCCQWTRVLLLPLERCQCGGCGGTWCLVPCQRLGPCGLGSLRSKLSKTVQAEAPCVGGGRGIVTCAELIAQPPRCSLCRLSLPRQPGGCPEEPRLRTFSLRGSATRPAPLGAHTLLAPPTGALPCPSLSRSPADTRLQSWRSYLKAPVSSTSGSPGLSPTL